jgi:hypothetical protein
MLDPFQFEKMRYRWRRRCTFDCNWKVAMEAFIETYHVEGTHPQLIRMADFYTWSKPQGLHSVHGFAEREHDPDIAANNTIIRSGRGGDRLPPRSPIGERAARRHAGWLFRQRMIAAGDRLADLGD